MLGSRHRRPPRKRLFAIVVALVTTFVAGIVACSSSSSSGIAPVTGILIRAETLTAAHGCGQGPTQLRKYAAVVYGLNPSLVTSDAQADRRSYDVPLTGNVFDCYADGAFLSLPNTGGNTTYRLEVFAYNQEAYGKSQAEIDRASSAPDPDSLRNTTNPTWTTECTATQQENVQALANCNPLGPGLSGLGVALGGTKIALDTSSIKLPGGRVATCATASPPDAGTDASDDAGQDAETADGATDASDAAPPVDTGAPITFTAVRVRLRINATIVGPAVDVACPTPFLADVAAEPASYQVDVALLDSTGNLVPNAQTVCTATTQTGTTSSAVCP